MRSVTLGIVAAGLLAGLWAPSALSRDAAKSARRLMVSSGLEVQLGGFERQIGAQLGRHRGRMPDEVVDLLAEAAREAFRPEALRSEILKGLPLRLTAEQMDRTADWLDGPGRRVTQAEEAGAGGPDPVALRAFAERVKAKPLPAARQALFVELVAVTNSVALNARLMESMAFAVMLGIDGTQPAEKRLGPERLRAQLRQHLPPEQLAEQLRFALPLQYSFTYRDVSDADLAAYVAFLRGPVGKPYNEAVFEVFTDVLVAASYRMGQLVDIALAKKRT